MPWVMLLAALLIGGQASAGSIEPYMAGGVGASMFHGLPGDGTWYQQPFPHSFTTTAVAWRAGVGARMFQDWTVEAVYVSLGAAEAKAKFVWDHNYDAVAHRCLAECEQLHRLHNVDHYHGVEVTFGRRFVIQGPVVPFLRLGGAMLWHRGVVWGLSVDGADIGLISSGTMPSFVVAGGACYRWLCAETAFYQAVGHSGNPISTQILVPMLSVRVPIDSGAW